MAAKTSRTPKTGAPKYHRLTVGKRSIIWELRRGGKSKSYIARELGVARSTVTRELNRNKSRKGYRYLHAQALANRRARVKARKRRKFTEGMWAWAMARLVLGWSFPAIVGRARLEGVAMVCAETLYQEYYRRQKAGEKLPPLPRAHRKRRRRGKRYADAGRGRIPGRVDISERPAEVETRKEVGHAEGDLINGAPGTGHLVTVTERATRFTWFVRVGSKEDSEVAAALVKLLAPLPKGLLKTLTFDNGKEFAKFEQIEQALGIEVYFAKPYHSWERGTNENRNGVVRKVLPKGTSFAAIPSEALRRADERLNDRPLRCLGWRTPREALAAAIEKAAKEAGSAA